jgi:hypothetical protein
MEGAQTTVVGFKSKDLIEWVDKNIEQKLALGIALGHHVLLDRNGSGLRSGLRH